MANIEGIRIHKLQGVEGCNPRKTMEVCARGDSIDSNNRRNRKKRGWQKLPVRRLRLSLADCLKLGVEEACDERGRGGFDRIHSQGATKARYCSRFATGRDSESQLITYELGIDKDDPADPSSFWNYFSSKRSNDHGLPRAFLMLSNGEGVAWKGEAQGQQIDEDCG